MATRRTSAGGSGAGVVRAVGYARVSTDEQGDEGLSLPAQHHRIIDYCARHGWVLVDTFSDVESGTRADRAGYLRALAEVKRLRQSGHVAVLVVVAVDRLGRRLSEFARAYEVLGEQGATLHSVREGGEIAPFTAGLLGTFAAEESRRISARVREVIASTERNGWHFPGGVAWGYRLRPATADERDQGAPRNVLDVDEATAPYVREAFARVAGGASVRSVARWIAGLPAETRRGKLWPYNAVRAMLRARVYAGQTADGHAGRWPALVDGATWAAVQRYLSPARTAPARQASGEYLLTGLLRCEKCGARMAGHAGRSSLYPRYRCQSDMQGAASSGPVCCAVVSCAVLDRAVLDQVDPIIAGAPAVIADELSQAAREVPAADVSPLRQMIERAEQVQATAEREIGGLARALARGDLSPVAYKAAVAGAEADYAAAATELERLHALPPPDAAPDLEGLAVDVEAWARVWRGGATVDRRELLHEYVLRVVPVRDPATRRAVGADVTLTPTGEYIRARLAVQGKRDGA